MLWCFYQTLILTAPIHSLQSIWWRNKLILISRFHLWMNYFFKRSSCSGKSMFEREMTLNIGCAIVHFSHSSFYYWMIDSVFTVCSWLFHELRNKRRDNEHYGRRLNQTFSQLNSASLPPASLENSLFSLLDFELFPDSPGFVCFRRQTVEGHYNPRRHEYRSPSILGQSHAVCPGVCVLCRGTRERLAFSVSLPNAWRRWGFVL